MPLQSRQPASMKLIVMQYNLDIRRSYDLIQNNTGFYCFNEL